MNGIKFKIWNKKKIAVILLFAILILIFTTVLITYLFFLNLKVKSVGDSTLDKNITVFNSNSKDSSKIYSKEYLKALVPENDSNERVIKYSDYESYLKSVEIDDAAGLKYKKVYTGRRINIAVTGVDSRLGTNTKHADANHVLSILLDSGKIEIISVPRDTPADAGYDEDDTTGQNKLTIVRAGRGLKSYHVELAKIAGLDKIHYYIEFGFSQAIGLIELLGHKNAVQTLKVLRSRTGLGGDDFQRVYNQAQFIKQNLIANFNAFNSLMGDMVIRAGLSMVDSDIPLDKLFYLRDELKKKGFGNKIDDVIIKIRPPMPIKFKIYDLEKPEVIMALSSKIDAFHLSQMHDSDNNKIDMDVNNSVSKQLSKIIYNSKNAKLPANGIKIMTTLYNQRAWLQVSDLKLRDSLRTEFCNTLAGLYFRKKDSGSAQKVLNYLDLEKQAFKERK
jgi:anionic cell wall polymer biosynthesis LytR-Cps2A-Psr (LCP) family protein